MQTETIWESAGRPLFLRSVWLETQTNARRRSHQRHFILDYDSQVQERQQRLASSPLKRKIESPKSSPSPQSSLEEDSDSCVVETNEDLLIGSGKVKLHRPGHPIHGSHSKPSTSKCSRRQHHHRRNFSFHNKYKYNAYDHMRLSQSRRSSLQDLQSNLSQTNPSPDERLAERVLNWLDLAGKTDFLRPQEEAAEAAQSKKPTPGGPGGGAASQGRRRSSLIGRGLEASQRNFLARRNSMSSKKFTHKKSCSGVASCRFDSVKHITIIFNKDGVPVRFNRPARNIDLYALSSSPATVRRLAGPLASARLYKSTDGIMSAIPTTRQAAKGAKQSKCAAGKTEESPRAEKVSEKITSKTECLVAFEDTIQSSTFNDAKKQLHIFMPSLPKKAAVTAGSDDATSILSNTFSELCRV